MFDYFFDEVIMIDRYYSYVIMFNCDWGTTRFVILDAKSL